MSIFSGTKWLWFAFAATLITLPKLSLQAQSFGQERISLDFACVSFEKLDFPELYYLDSGEYLRLPIAVRRYPPLSRLNQTDALRLFLKKTDEQGEIIYVQCAEAALIPDASRMLFIISIAQQANPWPIQLLGIDDSLDKFPPGAMRFLNGTPVALKVNIHEESDTLETGKMTILKPEIANTGGFYPFIIEMLDGSKLYETQLYGQSRARKTVLIGPPRPGSQRLQVMFLSHVVPKTS